MRILNKIAAGIALSLTLGTAAIAYAHPGAMRGDGMGPGAQDGPQAGMSMKHGMRGGQGHAGMGHGAHGPQAAQQLMTPEERAATMEKMRAAKTPEERQQIAAATRAEMQKRAADRGITLPEHRGPRFGTTPQAAPADAGHTH